LRNVSFSVPEGKALCILGRSGTGKSVTLKLLMALIKPDQGSIWVDGDDITRLKPAGVSKARRKMGFLFPDAALIDFAIHDVLRQVGLAGDKDKLPSRFRVECENERASRGRSSLNPRFFSRTNRAAALIESPRLRSTNCYCVRNTIRE
jgi:ABC-type lipoprotein export system ATPase subunit